MPGQEVSGRWPEVLAAALAAGIAGDLLLRPWPWGLGAALWIGLVVALLGIVTRPAKPGAPARAGDGRWLAAAALCFAGALAWRDAWLLRGLNVLLLLVTLGLATARLRLTGLARAGIADLTADLLRAGAGAAFGGVPMLLSEIRWRAEGRQAWRGAALAGLRGLLIGVPLLVVFGALLMAADPVFGTLVGGWLRVDLFNAGSHLLVVALLAWGVAGAFREALAGRPWTLPEGAGARRPRLGTIELGVVLGLLDALFLAFVAVQFRYLFGGASLVRVVPGLTYAEYARRGFFELVSVAALALAVLLATHWLLRRDGPAGDRVYRTLAWGMVGLVAVMMASGVYRMWVYYDQFGLTPLRLYATAFMVWLAAVFAWFCATVLRERRERFACGALAAGLAVGVLLNFLNPDGLVAQVNAGRAATGRPVDAWHLASLSADAAPALVAALDGLPGQDRRMVAERLLARWGDPARSDWRTWNWGQATARRAVQAHRAMLLRLAQPPPR